MSEPADLTELVERASTGDREAFSELLQAQMPGVRAFLYRMGTPAADLDDLTQEVFVAVIRGLKTYRGQSRFSTWVLGIAVNLLRKWRRQTPPVIEQAPPQVDQRPGPPQALVNRERGEHLRDALRRLPASLREAFVLRHIEEIPATEVAVLLGVPEGTVRRRAFVARERLRATLLPREVSR